MTDVIPPLPSGPHPTPEELYRARLGPRDAAAERVLLHAAGCAVCSTELAHQDAFDQPGALPPAALEAAWERFGREPAARRAPSRAPLLALAAALAACVLGLAVWNAQHPPEPADVERGAPVGAATGSPTGNLSAPPAEITFPNPQGEPLRVRVFDESQAYAWTSEPTPGTRVALPEAQRRRLRPGVEYFWTVVGGGEGGAVRSFRIRPPA